MSDYISREAAIECAKGHWYKPDIAKALEQLPPADVRENVKGFWYALNKGDRGYSAGDFCCSICGKPNNTWIPKPNFCQNCGADMREGTK